MVFLHIVIEDLLLFMCDMKRSEEEKYCLGLYFPFSIRNVEYNVLPPDALLAQRRRRVLH